MTLIDAMNYVRGWEGRADWRVLFVGQVQSWVVMVALIFVIRAMLTGVWWEYVAALALAALEVPLGITFMTQWRFDLGRYMEVVDRA